MYKYIYRIILDHLKVETSGDGHKGVEAAAGEYRGVRIRFRTGLLVSSNHEARLTLDEAPVFIEFVDVDPYIVEDLDLLLERGPADFNL